MIRSPRISAFSVALTLTAATLAGTYYWASAPQTQGRTDYAESKRTNAAEAARWYCERRQPVGSNLCALGEPLPAQPYLDALKQIETMPHYSINGGRYEAPSQNRAAGPSATNTSLTQKWLNLGPGFRSSGRLRGLVVAKNGTTTTRRIYAAAASGGIFRSDDSGTSWTAVGDGLVGVLRIGSLVIDPRTDTPGAASNTHVLYAGTGEGYSAQLAGDGIYKSTDGGSTWTLLANTTGGPGAGNFRFVNKLSALDDSTKTLVFAATSTGVWRTSDNGTTWERVYALAQNGTDRSNVVVSNTGCQDVNVRFVNPGIELLAACQFDPADGNGNRGRIVRAVNAEAAAAAVSYAEVLGGAVAAPAAPNLRRAVIARSASAPATIYVSAARTDSRADGIYQSTNAGATWTTVVQTTATTDQVTDATGAFVVTGGVSAHGKVLFTNVSDFCNNAEPRGARGPTTLADGRSSQGDYDQIIAVDPLNPDIIFVGGIDQSRSTDGGKTWEWITNWEADAEDKTYGHADHHLTVFDPDYNGTSNQIMYIGNDGGVQRTDNARATGLTHAQRCARMGETGKVAEARGTPIVWTNLTRGMVATQFYDGQVDPISQSYVFGGSQDNGTPRSNDRAPKAVAPASGLATIDAWNEINGGDGTFAAITNDGAFIFTATTNLSISRADNAAGLDANKFDQVIGGITNAGFSFVNPYVLDPQSSATAWTAGNAIWRSTNATVAKPDVNTPPPVAWTQASAALVGCGTGGDNESTAIAVNPRDSKHVLFGRKDGCIYRNFDALNANNATAWAATGVNGATPVNVSSIAFDPSNSATAASATVYATVSTLGAAVPKVVKSTDGGVTWASANGNLPDIPANTILVDPDNAQRLFLGTDLGVFVSTDGGGNWAVENDGLARVQVIRLQLRNTTGTATATSRHGKNLYAFTYGRGAYVVSIKGDGTCGTASGVATATAPSGTSLCSTGSATAVAGSSGAWRWGCNGFGGGTNTAATACTANYAAQTISNFISTPSSLTVGGGNGTLSANSTGSSNPVTFASTTTNICTVSGTNGSALTPVAQGTCMATADKAGTGDNGTNRFLAAPQQTLNVTVAAAGSAINGVCGTGNGTTTAPAPSGGALCSAGNATTVAGTNGAWRWGCSGTGGGTSTAANACTASYATQTISNFISTPSSLTVGGGNGTLSASSTGSANPVTFASATTNICTVSGTNGSTLSPVAQGTCAVTANKAGTGDGPAGTDRFLAASPQSLNLTVAAATAGGGSSPPGTPVTDANGQTVTIASDRGMVASVGRVAQPAGAMPERIRNLSYPNGFFSFRVTGVGIGGTATVNITLPAGSAPNTVVKCSSATDAATCSEFGGRGINGNIVTLTLVDGGTGDADGVANGTIVDPFAPATGNVLLDRSGAMGWWALLPLALLGMLRRRRAH